LYQRRFEKDTKTMRDFAAQVIKTRKEQPETHGGAGHGTDHRWLGAFEYVHALVEETLHAGCKKTRPRFLTRLLYQRRFEKDTKTMRDFAAQVIKTRKGRVGRFIASMVAPAMALIIGGSAPSSTCTRWLKKHS
jgi:hypothetical protein